MNSPSRRSPLLAFRPTHRSLFGPLALLALCLATHDVTAADPGLSATPPATGPVIQTDQGYMLPYTATIPGTQVTFEMVPVPGGTYRLGSPEAETDRQADEGPQVEVKVEPFWIGKYEVTWSEYKEYMRLYNQWKEFSVKKVRAVNDQNKIDAVTTPTPLYDPSYTFSLGEDPRHPAVTMTRYAARQYTKWLSLLTSQFYRLPTEAEWEYACRAGTETAYSFGDDPAPLDDYAWYFDNADETYHPVGEKKPNAWGLYDMHGNVAELVLDPYSAEAYQAHAGKQVTIEQLLPPTTKIIPSVIRGGAWDYEADRLRSAARGQTEKWCDDDPNLPKSPWWFSDDPSQCVGFRILRPLKDAPREQREAFWQADLPVLQQAIDDRMSEGRGVRGLVDPALPQAIQDNRK